MVDASHTELLSHVQRHAEHMISHFVQEKVRLPLK